MSSGQDLIFRYMGVTLSYAQPCLLVSEGQVIASAGSPSSIDQKKLFDIVCIKLRGGTSGENSDDPLEQTAQKICEFALQNASREDRWTMAKSLEQHKSEY